MIHIKIDKTSKCTYMEHKTWPTNYQFFWPFRRNCHLLIRLNYLIRDICQNLQLLVLVMGHPDHVKSFQNHRPKMIRNCHELFIFCIWIFPFWHLLIYHRCNLCMFLDSWNIWMLGNLWYHMLSTRICIECNPPLLVQRVDRLWRYRLLLWIPALRVCNVHTLQKKIQSKLLLFHFILSHNNVELNNLHGA